MKIDVSDLFGRLYNCTYFAREQFDPLVSLDEGERLTEWVAFCNRLSDALFVPACAARAFSLTHATLPLAAAKSRLIIRHDYENGSGTAYLRYEHPCQHSSAFSALGDSGGVLSHKSKLPAITLWLGKLPPERVERTPLPYPAVLDAPVRYFAKQYMGFFRSTGPCTTYYEFHGDWCLRKIEQHGPTFVRYVLNGQWLRPTDTIEIADAAFNAIWEGAVDASLNHSRPSLP